LRPDFDTIIFMKKIVSIFLLTAFLLGCTSEPKKEEKKVVLAKAEEFVPSIDYTVVNKYPHDITSFTEGFCFHNNELFESTGATENLPQTKSLFGTVDLKTGKINTKVEIDKTKYFGEGIVFLNKKVYQLTYKNQICFLYDDKTFKQSGQFNYQNKEGWGLTTDGTSVIMSDGTDVLTFLNPNDFSVSKKLNVTNGGAVEDNLNELEFINGYIYANIWMKNYIVKINPQTGKVEGILNLAELTTEAREKNAPADVLNGIAFDAAADKIYVTGKMWPSIYEINFKH
jgi:hypothetical protein